MAGHNPGAPGFSQMHDPFAGLSRHDNDGEALDFEDTYDGLGDQLDEADDAFNDDTFGGEDSIGTSNAPIGKDFDFFGSTAKVSNAIEEEQMRFVRHQPAPKTTAPAPPDAYQNYQNYGYPTSYVPAPSRPARTGYEKYRDPEPTADLQIDASIWGTAPKKAVIPVAAPQSQPSQPPTGRKVMSLEEVEAAIRAHSKPAASQPGAQPQVPVQPQQQFASPQPQIHRQAPQYPRQEPPDYRFQQPEIQTQDSPSHDIRHVAQAQVGSHGHPVTILQRPLSKHSPAIAPSGPSQVPGLFPPQQQQPPMHVPTQILQNPKRIPGDGARMPFAAQPMHPAHRSQTSFSHQQPIITHPSQLNNLTDQEKAAYLEAEAKRAKRNHKIHVLSKHNGLMTPQDKSFITRIQLQQLVSATGDPNEHGTHAALEEDFYYQVHNSLSVQRGHPSQPLNNFAQTYLYQTGNRQNGMRRHRGPENHMQRMEQQVQRAVEAAKNKPKNKQLVIEGSLGKISFSNAKTPKPLLNIKRTDSGNDVNRPGSAPRAPPTADATDFKVILRAIESVFTILMKMEDHERTLPPPLDDSADQELIERNAEWRSAADNLNAELWDALGVQQDPVPNGIHPFIAFLNFPKGKKVFARVFRQLSMEQRTTILTLIIVHLDQLDVIRAARVQYGEPLNLSAAMRESIEVFTMAVLPSILALLNELELHIISGELGLIIQKQNIDHIARTRVGINVLTMLLSHAEVLKSTGRVSEQAWNQWMTQFSTFFNLLEPTLPYIFPGTVTSGEDVYVWQFLAAIGVEANTDEQQRLVLQVKDRVMDTISLSKTLPVDLAKERLDSVNLFMRSIGLDVELLQ